MGTFELSEFSTISSRQVKTFGLSESTPDDFPRQKSINRP
jgi:hypothetical protein